MKWEEIQERSDDLRRRSRDRVLEAMGRDVDAVHAAEEETEEEFGSLIEEVRGGIAELDDGALEAHEESLIEADRTMAIRAERAIVDLERDRGILGKLYCDCWLYWPTSYEYTDHVPFSGTGTGSVTFAPPEVAHPIVEATSPGVGGLRTATIAAQWVYSFTPGVDRLYCIKPVVQMSGHWLLWTWGTCAGDPAGTGKVHVKITTEVHQLLKKLKSKEVKVLDKSVGGGSSGQSGFAFNSITDADLGITALLQAGDQAVIKVQCELYAEIANQGRAWVDMQTSPAFHCKVPVVWRGPVVCWPFPV